MSKLEELIQELCPDGVEYKPIGEAVNYEQPTKYIVESTKYDDNYDVPVLTAGQSFILGYTNEEKGIYNASKINPVIIFDDFTGAFKWVDFPFKVKSSAMKVLKADTKKTTLRYIFHVMGNIDFSSGEHKRLWITIYSTFQIPLPPLEVQQEIVRILDSFTELTAELTTELTARKQQYEYYRDKLLTFGNDIEYKSLSDVVNRYVDGMHNLPDTTMEKGKHPILSAQNINNGFIDLNTKRFVSDETFKLENKRTNVQIGDVLLTIVGAIGRVAVVQEDLKALFQRSVCIIKPNAKMVTASYLKYILESSKTQDYIQKNAHGAAQKGIYLEQVGKIRIPLPPLDIQNKIVQILDHFDTFCNDLSTGLPAEIEARQKQYEYYRDKLLDFKEIN